MALSFRNRGVSCPARHLTETEQSQPAVFRNIRDSGKREDQRVRRTRQRLADALVQLLVAKPFDAITVQNILEAAHVSRSTFYAHFRDKNDLFLSQAEDFFEAMATALSRFGDKSQRLAPVEELFAHLGEVRPFYNALLASGRMHDVMELGEEHFARGIEQRLREIPRARKIRADQLRSIAHGLAGSLFSQLTWWVREGMTVSPAEMDRLFHKIAWSGTDGTKQDSPAK